MNRLEVSRSSHRTGPGSGIVHHSFTGAAAGLLLFLAGLSPAAGAGKPVAAGASPAAVEASREKEFRARVEKVLRGELAGLDTAGFLADVENRLARKQGQEPLTEAAGMLNFHLGRFDQARHYLMKLKKPGSRADRLLALSLYELGEYRKSLAYFSRLREVRAARWDWEKYCLALSQGGRKADALKEWEDYHAKYPGSDAGLEFMVEGYRRPPRKDKLIPALEALLRKVKGAGAAPAAAGGAPAALDEAQILLELSGLYGETHVKALELRTQYLRLRPDNHEAARGLGAMYEARGDEKKAAEVYREAAQYFPSDLKFQRRLAFMLLKLDKQAALAYFARCRALAPKDMEIALALARLLEELKRPDAALEAYGNALEINPTHAAAKARMVALAEGRRDEGPWLASMVENERKNPRDHAFQFQLAKLFVARQDKDAAYKYLQKALQNGPGNAEYAALLPKVLVSDAQILKYFPILQQMGQKPDPSADLMLLLGRGYSLFRNPVKAAEAYARVLALSPRLLDGMRQPILDLAAAKDCGSAAALADRFLAGNGKDLEVRRLQVGCLAQNNAPPAKLRAAINGLIALEPYNEKWYLRLAELDLAAGDSAAALAHALEWTKLNPEDKAGFRFLEPLARGKGGETYLGVLDNLGRLEPAQQNQYDLKTAYYLVESGQYAAAVEALGKLTAAFPNDARFWSRFGTAQAKLGREGAPAALEKAYRLEPGNVEYARAFGTSLKSDVEIKPNLDLFLALGRAGPNQVERKKLARALYLNGDYRRSAQEWDWFQTVEPEAAVGDSTAALAYLKSGQAAKARPLLEKRLARNPRDVELLATLSDLYGKENDPRRRIAMMERLVQEDQNHGNYLLRLAQEKEKSGQAGEALMLYSQWAFRHEEDVASLKAYHRLAEKQKDTSSLIEALRFLTRLKEAEAPYRFQLAELYYDRSGEIKEIQGLVKAFPTYRTGKLILVREYHGKAAWDQLAALEGFLASESASQGDLLEPLADLYAHQGKTAQAHKAYYEWLAVRRRDRSAFDKVYRIARQTQSPYLTPILKMGAEAFPQDLDLAADYGAALGLTRSALDVYQDILSKRPNDAASVAQAAEIARALGDKALTAKWAKRWSELKSGEEKPWVYLSDAAQVLGDRNTLAGAWEGLLRLQPGNGELMLKLARLQEQLGRFDKAIALYRAALYLAPKDRAIREKLIALMKEKGKKEDLADVLTEIQNIDTSAHEAQFELAKLYLQRKDKEKAYAYLSTALEQSPHNHVYQLLLPKAIHSREQTLRHLPLLQEIAKRPETSRTDPGNADLFLLLARGYVYQGQWEPAAAHYALAYRLAPKRVWGDREAIVACFRGKEFGLSAELAEKYFDPTRDFDKEIRQIQILSYEKVKRDDAVIRRTLQLLLAVDRENAGGLIRLAELDVRARDTSAAINNIRNCLMTNPGEVRAYKMLLPLVEGRADQKVTYVVVLEKLAQLDSAQRPGYNLRLANFYFDRKNYREAGKLYSEVAEDRPKDAQVWYRLGQCRNTLQVGDQGLSSFKNAYQLDPANAVYAHTFAQSLQSKDEVKGNLKLFQFVENRGPSLHERRALALAYYFNGDFNASSKAWDRALAEDPGEKRFISEAALAYLRTKQPAKALPLYQTRLVREGENLDLLDTLCALYGQTGETGKRTATLEALVRVDATYKDYQLQLAQAKEKAGDSTEAISQYGQWTARHPADAPALKSMHRLAQAKRDTASLENALRMLVRIKGTEPEYAFQLAELTFKFAGDVADLERLVKAYPKYFRGRIILAKEYYRRYDIAGMIPYEKALAEEATRDKDLLGPLAELYAYQEKKSLAHKAFFDHLNAVNRKAAGARGGADLRQAFEKAWIYGEANNSPYLAEVLDIGNQSFPGDPAIQRALAAALGKDPRALELYKQILAKDGADLGALRSGAELAMALGKPREAVPWLETWTSLEPGASKPWQALVEAHTQLKDPARLADALEHLLQLSPADHALAFRTGQAFLKAGNREKALELYIRADELKPKDATYAVELMDLLRAMSEDYLSKGQAGKAVEIYGLVLARDPRHKKANLYMGMWLAQNQDFASAEPMLKLGLDQSPEPPPMLAKAWKLLGDCESSSGQFKEGLEAYKRALLLDPQDKAASLARLDMTRAMNLKAEMAPALSDVVRLDSANLDACAALAEIRYQEGSFPAAAALYRRVVSARADDKEAWTHYGEALEGSKRDAEALGAWEKAYALGDRSPYMLQGLTRLYQERKTLDKAEKPLEDLVALQPENDEAAAALAELSLRQGNLERAEEMFAQASQSAPEKIVYVEGLGEVYMRRGDVESALELLEPALSRLTPAGRLTFADVLRQDGKSDSALPIYEKVYAQQPSGRALAGLAEAWLERKKPLEAKRVIEASDFQKDPEVRLRLAKAWLSLRDRGKAASMLAALVQENKDNALYLYNLGLAHYEQKNLSQALKEFRQALAKQPELHGAAYHAGLILLSQGQGGEARNTFFALSESVRRPARAMGLRGLAAASLAEKKPAEASDYLVQAAVVNPSPDIFAELSRLCLKLDRPQEAEEWAQKSLEADEDYPDGIVSLAEVMMAQNKRQDAQEFLKEALARNPRSCELHMQNAKVNLALENFQGIASTSRQTLTMCPDEPLSYFYAGVAADRSYQKKEAEEYFKYYVKMGGDKSQIPKGY